jgi:hypothetical protein
MTKKKDPDATPKKRGRPKGSLGKKNLLAAVIAASGGGGALVSGEVNKIYYPSQNHENLKKPKQLPAHLDIKRFTTQANVWRTLIKQQKCNEILESFVELNDFEENEQEDDYEWLEENERMGYEPNHLKVIHSSHPFNDEFDLNDELEDTSVVQPKGLDFRPEAIPKEWISRSVQREFHWESIITLPVLVRFSKIWVNEDNIRKRYFVYGALLSVFEIERELDCAIHLGEGKETPSPFRSATFASLVDAATWLTGFPVSREDCFKVNNVWQMQPFPTTLPQLWLPITQDTLQVLRTPLESDTLQYLIGYLFKHYSRSVPRFLFTFGKSRQEGFQHEGGRWEKMTCKESLSSLTSYEFEHVHDLKIAFSQQNQE